MKIAGFDVVVDLSSSMVSLSPCRGNITKDEAVTTLLRKINSRIPSNPYYDSDRFDQAMGRLAAAYTISPFNVAIRASEGDLSQMKSPRAVLMFSDYELSSNLDDPAGEVKKLSNAYSGTKFYAFYVTRRSNAKTLAREVGTSGLGNSYDICQMLVDDGAFESMMDEIFGPKIEPKCSDIDGDGVCDSRDVCPSTPKGAPVDNRGCWIAAYAQFFDFDKSVVKNEFHPRLEYAAKLINENPNLREIVIAGHTDSVGTDEYNLNLGEKRAEAVKAILVKSGVDTTRLKVESFGKSMPIADNSTEEGRAKNRRVEFHVGDVPISPVIGPPVALAH
jgi:OOP family OmpA-OmpF porin